MLRVPRLSQRLCQLGVERDDGPSPPLDPANSLRENDWTCDETLRREFQPEHTRVLAGEQLQHSEQSGVTTWRSNCRGGPPWPPLPHRLRRGGHGGPPLESRRGGHGCCWPSRVDARFL